MPSYVERRRIPYTRQQIFDLIADVESYPDFLPHVLASRIRARDGNTVHVDMLLGFGILRRRVTSTGVLAPYRIDITSRDPPLQHFELHWAFERLGVAETMVELRADLELRSKFWQKLLASYFKAEVAAMIDAFERRARQLYNGGASGRSTRS